MKHACVIGWPIGHSRSPLIHGYWLKKYAIAGSYTKQAVAPDELSAFLGSLAEKGFAGCNVTVPHKEAAFALADRRDDTANTDGIGFMAHLNERAPGWRIAGGPVSILGAGGAARAIVHGFLSSGVGEIRIFNRTGERADELAAHFGAGVRAFDWHDRAAKSRRSAVIVNTTTLGMTGSAPLEMDLSDINEQAVIADIVYAPLTTDLLARASRRGLKTVDGLGMLLHQAVPGFEKWFGRRPEVTDELRALITSDLVTDDIEAS